MFQTAPASVIVAQEGLIGGVVALVPLLILIVAIAGMWKTFDKAGQPGWAAIIPIYNIYVLLQITDNPVWYLILFLVPLVNIIISIKVLVDLSKAFGQGIGFALGLVFLSFIFWPLLGFGDYQFRGSRGAGTANY